MAPGPWIRIPGNLDYVRTLTFEGGLLEVKGIDDDGKPQGTFVGIVTDVLPEVTDKTPKPTRIKLKVLGSSDKEYWAWVKDHGNPMWFYLNGKETSKPHPMKHGTTASFPIAELRFLTYVKDEELGVSWLTRRHACFKHIESAFGESDAAIANAKTKAEERRADYVRRKGKNDSVGSRPHCMEGGDDIDGESLTSDGDDVENDLKALRSDLQRGDGVAKPAKKSKKGDKEKKVKYSEPVKDKVSEGEKKETSHRERHRDRKRSRSRTPSDPGSSSR